MILIANVSQKHEVSHFIFNPVTVHVELNPFCSEQKCVFRVQLLEWLGAAEDVWHMNHPVPKIADCKLSWQRRRHILTKNVTVVLFWKLYFLSEQTPIERPLWKKWSTTITILKCSIGVFFFLQWIYCEQIHIEEIINSV